MDLTKFKEEIKKIDEETRIKKNQLGRKYALSHSNISIGDLVTDHLGTIRVEQIGVFLSTIPSCFYKGVCITKKEEPFKNRKKRNIFQKNIGNLVT